jgi:hypothetical protein
MAWKSIQHGKGSPPLQAEFLPAEVVAYSTYSNHEVMVVLKSGATLTLVGKDAADAQRIYSHVRAAL